MNSAGVAVLDSRQRTARAVPQYASELITSPPALVLSARQILMLIEFFMNLTLPSQNKEFNPLGCRLREAMVGAPVAMQGGFGRSICGKSLAGPGLGPQ